MQRDLVAHCVLCSPPSATEPTPDSSVSHSLASPLSLIDHATTQQPQPPSGNTVQPLTYILHSQDRIAYGRTKQAKPFGRPWNQGKSPSTIFHLTFASLNTHTRALQRSRNLMEREDTATDRRSIHHTPPTNDTRPANPSRQLPPPFRTGSPAVYFRSPPAQLVRLPSLQEIATADGWQAHQENMATNRQFIDLTAEDDSPPPPPPQRGHFGQAQRGPRFHTEIIDLSEDMSPRAAQEPSPEVQFVRQVRLAPPRLVPQRVVRPRPHSPQLPGLHDHHRVADDDVHIVAQNLVTRQDQAFDRIRHIMNVVHAGHRMAVHTHTQAAGRLGQMAEAFNQRLRTAPFRGPNLDYQEAAFQLGIDAMEDVEREPSPPPAIVALSPAPEGFTRSPEEEDVLVCPNCGDELSVGVGDLKKQVWMVKGCGHVSF